MIRGLPNWTSRLSADGWRLEHTDTGMLKSGPHGGRESHGALAICTPGIAFAFEGMLGRLGSERRFPWAAIQLFDGSDESGAVVSFGLGLELGVVTFMSDLGAFPSLGGSFPGGMTGQYSDPRKRMWEKVRPHLPKDGWSGFYTWSIHAVTKTKEELATFLLSFLRNSQVAEWQVVPVDEVAVRCVEVLGRDEAILLLNALGRTSTADRLEAVNELSEVHDPELLIIWIRALAGENPEGVDFEPDVIDDARAKLIAALQKETVLT